MGVGAAGTAAGSRRTASRRTRTQAAAGTACRRPPRGLSHVSHDRIHGRPSSFRRPHAPPTPRYRLRPVVECPKKSGTSLNSAGTREKFRGKSSRVREGPERGRERETERSGEARNNAQGSRECGESGGVHGAQVAKPADGSELSGKAGARGARRA
ncbi:jg16511 [Pararge aegeria aegeria]|uniref:Jg16511 protein n=1 Tax=Pararge aegeria aegeria TaxID=348720 RepID=A0A8S4SBC9_9NEOP|nr:jg16511 [Pararge aegeria aegeria]